MGLWQSTACAAIAAVLAVGVRAIRANAAVRADVRNAVRRPATWLVGVPTLLLVLLVGVPFVYLRATGVAPAKPLTFADVFPSTTTTAPADAASQDLGASASAVDVAATDAGAAPVAVPALLAAAPTDVSGSWTVGNGTQARYRVDDTAVGQTQTVVGATPDVTGSMTIADATVTAVQIVVNMQTVTCHCVHDTKYHQMLETDKYPTSTFELTNPIVLASIPADGVEIDVPVTGNFTIHGVTREVSYSLAAVHQEGRIAVHGEIPVNFSDYNIDSPDGGSFGGLSNCYIEFLVAFDRTG